MRPIDADMLKCYQFKNPISHKALCNLIDRQPTVNRMIGRWKEVPGPYVSPGGTPVFMWGNCGGSEHLYGAEYQNRKVICDNCGRINIYPWEKAHEEGSSLWEEDQDES